MFHCISRWPQAGLTRLLGFSIIFLANSAPIGAAGPPNIIVVLSDDAGYADFGFNANNAGVQPVIPTPHLDHLAKSGVVCDQAYVTASTCTPSRMGLMTGRYQQRFGAECNVPTIPTPGFTKQDLGLDTSQLTIANVLQSAGYETMAIGKWHLGELPKYHPNRRGFNHFYGFLGGSRSYWPQTNPAKAHAIRHNEQQINEVEQITYLTDQLTDAAIEFVSRSTASEPTVSKPFFIYLAYNAVHSPFQAKEADRQPFSTLQPEVRRTVAAMTKSMDDNIGRLLKHLSDRGIREDTLIVFLNDNGGTPGNAHHNGTLRGFKGTYWEGGIRVPMIISWPSRLPQGTHYDQPVSALDLLPTLAAAADSTDSVQSTDGVNLIPFLTGTRPGSPHERLFWRFWRVATVREGKWKLIRVAENPLKTKRDLLSPLILIDLESDPSETKNLATDHPDKTSELLDRLKTWEDQLTQPRWYDGSNWQHWQEQQVKNHRIDRLSGR